MLWHLWKLKEKKSNAPSSCRSSTRKTFFCLANPFRSRATDWFALFASAIPASTESLASALGVKSVPPNLMVGLTNRWQPTRQQHSEAARPVSRTNGDKESSRAQPALSRSQPRAVRPAAKPKASRHAIAGLLAKATSVCPWRRPSRRTGETKRFQLECLSPHRAVRRHRQKSNDRWRCPEKSVRSRSKLPNECAPVRTCSVGQPGSRRSLVVLGRSIGRTIS